MRVFKEGNWGGDICPICRTTKDGEVVLVGIHGTQEGHNMQAQQIHLDCIELTLYKGQDGSTMIAQKF
jgi:hypothetical protein